MTYAEKLKDPRWQKRRLEVLDLARWKCEDCGSSTTELHVHHTVYIPGKEPWEHTVSMLMSVCKPCHQERQQKEDYIRHMIGTLTRWLTREQLDAFMWDIIERVALAKTDQDQLIK